MQHRLNSEYSGRGFSKTGEIIEGFGQYTLLLKSMGIEFDVVACCGTSGLIIAPILAHHFNKKLLVVQKTNQHRHTSDHLDGFIGGQKYIIVDDFIDSGATIRRIVRKVKKYQEGANVVPPQLVSIFCYSSPSGAFKNIPVYCLDENFNLKRAK